MKVLKASCEQIGFVESLVRSRDGVYLVARGDNVKLWRVQREFEPVVTIREYEVATRGYWPVTVKFEYAVSENRASMNMSRKGLDRLKEILPEVFGKVGEQEGEEEFEVNRPLQPTKPEVAEHAG